MCLTEITRDVFVRVICVWQRNFEPAVCAPAGTHTAGSKLRCQTPITRTKTSQVISVKYVQHSLMMDRKRSETCRSDF